MIKVAHLKADVSQMKGEPMMLMFGLLSFVLIGVIKAIIVFGFPLVLQYVGFDLAPYEIYVTGLVYLLHPVLVGMVIGFFMLDEKDAKIFELLRVTPLGFSGYFMNRMFIPIILIILYTFITYSVIAVSFHTLWLCVVIGTFLVMQTVMIGMFIPMISEDKVKGLTNAKAVSGLVVFAFMDLVNVPMLQTVAKFVPHYYVAKVILEPTLMNIVVGLLVHTLWLFLIYRFALRKL